MSILDRLLNRTDPRTIMSPLYSAIVAQGREPHWYIEGGVPDTLDGRFDMIAAILCAILLRLEGEEAARQQSVWLTELFINDMDGQLRQIGIGDMIVGKHIGKMMSALGGRLAAYREGFASHADLNAALVRNLYRGDAPKPNQVAHVEVELRKLWIALAEVPSERIVQGHIPG